MTVPANHLYRVELLSESQIAQFKRDGMLVLPGVLDLDLCRRARDQMWEIIAEHRPSMQRDGGDGTVRTRSAKGKVLVELGSTADGEGTCRPF